jgi:nitroimidazol reductase NimA-like FMN-containing flavoprotein (pyridoxamine 5'-phosphate oxidase superfamily)
MLQTMKEIIRKNDLCVLATVTEGVPHCSLMSYVSDDEGHEIYMVSLRETQKYHNLTKNPSVSILIDNREEQTEKGRGNIKALTVKGEFHSITEPEKKDAVRLLFMKQRPHLSGFLNDPGCEIFSIRLKSFQLLDGVKDIFIETVG